MKRIIGVRMDFESPFCMLSFSKKAFDLCKDIKGWYKNNVLTSLTDLYAFYGK